MYLIIYGPIYVSLIYQSIYYLSCIDLTVIYQSVCLTPVYLSLHPTYYLSPHRRTEEGDILLCCSLLDHQHLAQAEALGV